MIERPKTAKDRIILALDVDNLKEARDLVRELKEYVGYFKVGLPLIVNYGFEAFRLLEEYGTKCYYDCKFHDIPHAVQKACIGLVKKNVDFFKDVFYTAAYFPSPYIRNYAIGTEIVAAVHNRNVSAERAGLK